MVPLMYLCNIQKKKNFSPEASIPDPRVKAGKWLFINTYKINLYFIT